MKLRITAISDTHSKHKQITSHLPGGDLLIHAGDISSYGYEHEVREFAKWFNSLNNYTHKIFIAGNHDFLFQENPQKAQEILDFYQNALYIQDSFVLVEDKVVVYGSPWQPEFHGWAFNLSKVGDSLKNKWDLIPQDCDILITHGPAFGRLDKVIGRTDNLGCEALIEAIEVKKPKLHICGHIHSGYGYTFDGNTHFINASVLDENYVFTQKPLTFDFDFDKNEIEFL